MGRKSATGGGPRQMIGDVPATISIVRSLARQGPAHWPRGVAAYERAIKQYFHALAVLFQAQWAIDLAEDVAVDFIASASIETSEANMGSNKQIAQEAQREPSSQGTPTGALKTKTAAKEGKKVAIPRGIARIADGYVRKHPEIEGQSGQVPTTWHGYLIRGAHNYFCDRFRAMMRLRRFEWDIRGDMNDGTGAWAILKRLRNRGLKSADKAAAARLKEADSDRVDSSTAASGIAAIPDGSKADEDGSDGGDLTHLLGELPTLRTYVREMRKRTKPGRSRRKLRLAILLRVLTERIHVPTRAICLRPVKTKDPVDDEKPVSSRAEIPKADKVQEVEAAEALKRAADLAKLRKERIEKYGESHEFLRALLYDRLGKRNRKVSRRKAVRSAGTRGKPKSSRGNALKEQLDTVSSWLRAGAKTFVKEAYEALGARGVRGLLTTALRTTQTDAELRISKESEQRLLRNPASELSLYIKTGKAVLIRMLAGQAFGVVKRTSRATNEARKK